MFTAATNPGHQKVILICSCHKAMEHRQRLLASTREVTEDIETLVQRESSNYCIHTTTALKLSSEDFCATDIPEEDEEMSDSVDLLSTNPFLAIAHCGSYGLVSKAAKSCVHSTFSCSHCNHKGCEHVTLLKEWCETNGLSEEIARR